ncbi:MAG TPA: trimethylamine methyltransferase family protein, partial [Anaerolineales bacterium]|nr:trimethylamine methyltransferase family protein [Anaerolineales bacterium]
RGWKESGSMDTFTRARIRVAELLTSYRRPELDPDKVNQLHTFVLELAKKAGLEHLPFIEDFSMEMESNAFAKHPSGT